MGWIHAGTGGGPSVMDNPLYVARRFATDRHNEAASRLQRQLSLPEPMDYSDRLYDWRCEIHFAGRVSVATLTRALAIEPGVRTTRKGRRVERVAIPADLRPAFEAALVGYRQLAALLEEIVALEDPEEIRRRATAAFGE